MRVATYVGFGFGAIQGGLFLYEAARAGAFERMVVAEVVPEVVRAVRDAGGRYRVNIATHTGVERQEVAGVEILNPAVPPERERLVQAVAEASEMATALPSVDFYGCGRAGDVVQVLAAGLERKRRQEGPPAVVYTAENHNRAAEILAERLAAASPKGVCLPCCCLNTVIGKMSGVVADPRQIQEQDLAPLAGELPRAFLVEAFNRILITRVPEGYRRRIGVFEEKADLLPFEEAKLYGHNATHALIGFRLRERGVRLMAEARQDAELMRLSRAAFLGESGSALCAKYGGVDTLFTDGGFAAYVDDLMERMLNEHLHDTVERITRDPRRKLGWEDRLVGTMRLALSQGVVPARFARGAAAAVRALGGDGACAEGLLSEIWGDAGTAEERKAVMCLVRAAL